MSGKQTILLVSAAIISLILYFNSLSSIRLRFADHYLRNREYSKAVRTYKKILRKELAAGRDLYFNKIGEKFARTYSSSQDIKFALADKLAGNALLSPPLFHQAVSIYNGIKSENEEYKGILSKINLNLPDEIETRHKDKTMAFLFNAAERYVQNQHTDSARAVLTENILLIFEPFEALGLLNNHFKRGRNLRLKQIIFDDVIYVVLEDFENTITQLQGYSVWLFAKEFRLDCDKVDNVGISCVIKCLNPAALSICAKVFFADEAAFVLTSKINVPQEGGWRKFILNDICGRAREIGLSNGWDTVNMSITGMGIKLEGPTDTVYLDDFRLFVSN